MQSPSLGADVLYMIVNYVGGQPTSTVDFLNLLTVSRGMYQIAARQFYREINIYLSSALDECCKTLISNDLAASSVRIFRILDDDTCGWSNESLSPLSLLLASALLRTTNLQSLRLETPPLSYHDPNIDRAYEILLQPVYSFKLRAFDFRPGPALSHNLTCVKEFIMRQDQIRRLALTPGGPLYPSDSLRFPLLREIRFHGHSMEDNKAQALFISHPQLTRVKIHYHRHGFGSSNTFRLDTVLKYAPNMALFSIEAWDFVQSESLLASMQEPFWGETVRSITFIACSRSGYVGHLACIFLMFRTIIPNLESVCFFCGQLPDIDTEVFATAPVLASTDRSWKFYFRSERRCGMMVTRDKGEDAEWRVEAIETQDIPSTHSWAWAEI